MAAKPVPETSSTFPINQPARLRRIELYGFKSIRKLEMDCENLTVLIGANGAGKSNLISFFRMLSWAMSKSLQQYILQKEGGANSLLWEGSNHTQQIKACLKFESKKGNNEYDFHLAHAANDTLIYTTERFRFSDAKYQNPARWVDFTPGSSEAQITDANKFTSNQQITANTIKSFLKSCNVFQFHDTSQTARMRGRWGVEDGFYLKEDGANIAAFLYYQRQNNPPAYRRILDTILMILPFLDDFEFQPENHNIMLRWRERGSDMVFAAHQASDGMLRAIALCALLLQPEGDLPGIIILDEPELGLHPKALEIIAGLIQSAACNRQIILATQSATLVDFFNPEDVCVVERPNRESTFRRLSSETLREWLDDYSLGQLWGKNVTGGNPF